jgi:glucose/arabinose dehydrogenase
MPLTAAACLAAAAAALAFAPSPARAQDAAATAAANAMDYGRFLSHTVTAPQPAGNVAVKGIAIKLGGTADGAPGGAVLFDTELCRIAAGWTGGFLDLRGVAFTGEHGSNPSIKGTQLFGTKIAPGWAGPDGRLDDPRPRTKDQGADMPYGPLPREWAKYKGLYAHGDQVVLSYTLGGVDVLELPGVEKVGESTVITRTLKVAPHDRELLLRVAEVVGADLWVKPVGTPADAMVEGRDGALFLKLAPSKEPALFKLLIGVGVQGEPAPTPLVDPATLIQGGPPRWSQTVEVKGALGGSEAAAYVVDTIPVPEANPYNAWIRFAGLDFFPDGASAALSTWNGDVWVCSGIDDKLEKLTWRRYASGMFQTLGLKIVDGKVYTLGRDQITRLHDLNADGEADFYENFNNDVAITPGFHEFAFDLQTDPQGDFYFIKGGAVRGGGRGFEPVVPHHGCVLRVSKDGSRLAVFATGFRAPNGMSVGPMGQVTSGDNQGTWMPACRLNWVKPGGFYGVVDLAQRDTPPVQTDNPLCWLPVSVDNSSGGQVWVTGDKWGPFAGGLLHTSYGQSALFNVLYEDAGGDVQGGVVRFPLTFESGIMRGRFSPRDGQLYVAGLKGWQTNAVKDACFQRVRYTGKPANMPAGLKVRGNGIEITFTDPLDRELAEDVESYGVEQWNYVWSAEYGSDEVSTTDPALKQHDQVEVASAKLSEDGKTVFLEIPGIRPVMQMKIQLNLDTAGGEEIGWEIYNTVNRVGNSRLQVKDRDVSVVNAGS